MAYSHRKHVASRLEQAQLRVPLLGGEAEAEAPEAAPEAEREAEGEGYGVYSWWSSKLWWTGLGLVCLTAALALLTLYTVAMG